MEMVLSRSQTGFPPAGMTAMQPLSILVLEDEPFQRLVTVTALQKQFCGPILQAADGEQAMAILHQSSGIDIVLCDLRMPGTDGLAFLRHASLTGKVGAVVLCSELDSVLRQATVAMIHCLGLPFLGDLGKPFSLEGFSGLLGRYRAYRQSTAAPLEAIELATLRDVQQGLDNGEFEAYYQPKVSLPGQRGMGAEVLARWAHPRWGVLTPAHFLPVMEQSGLVDQLFWQLLRQGLSLFRLLAAHGKPVNLAFNLHPAQLACDCLSERISALLKQLRVPPAQVTFEITESSLISVPAKSLENLLRLRIMGCGLAMDDFGAGYSSLQRLGELPFSQIKLDRSFVQRMQSLPQGEAIISCAIALARALDLSLVIEGVETSEQLARLVELGATFAQGFLFARPMPERLFIEYWGSARQADETDDCAL